MLRGQPDEAPIATPPNVEVTRPEDAAGLPSLDRPYETGERPPGILFYQPKRSFWRPYHLLQSMEFAADSLTLRFAGEEVVIHGRSLHPLYVALARHEVWRVVEQGERDAALVETGTVIAELQRIAHAQNEAPQSP